MARRSSGSGIALAVLILIGIVASLPKEARIILIVFGVIGVVIYLYSKSQSKSSSSVSLPSARDISMTVFRSGEDDIDVSVTSKACWVAAGNIVTVAGVTISGGMLYVGKDLATVAGHEIEPALINPKLRAQVPTGPIDQMGYWPSYSRIPELARGGYLQWLAGGRKDPNVQTGFVFLFFYGLERRVLHDLSQDKEAVNQELPAILAEVRRLLSIYGGSSGSFYGYANSFLDIIVTVGARDRIYRLPAPSQGKYKALTLRHKVALGQIAVDGMDLPVEWAYSWLTNDERFFLRTPAKRCPEEFKKLFSAYYAEKFGDGMKLPVNKTKLKTLYRPASASFGYGHVELGDANLPDVTVLEGPLNKLSELAERATEQLDSYSRLLGRSPEKKSSMDALVFLPSQLWPKDTVQSLKSWLSEVGADRSVISSVFGKLVKHFPRMEEFTKDRVAAFASVLEEMGVGMEPDVRWGGAVPIEDSNIVLFPITSDERGVKPSEPYKVATLALHIAAAVTASDGEVSEIEKEHLEEQLERWLHLGQPERSRLRAHLKWLLLLPPTLTALKKRVSVLNEEQKRSIAAFLINVSQVENGVSPNEIKVLAKVYRLFGLDEKTLYSHIHAVATEPVTVKPACTGTPSFGVPPKPETKQHAGFVLDHNRIAALKADTQRVSAMLGAIFTEEEATEVVADAPDDKAEPEGYSIVGLDTGHSELVRLLVSRDSWVRAELEDLASDRGIMLDGALERINEAFIDKYNEPLLDGDDTVQVNKNITRELNAA